MLFTFPQQLRITKAAEYRHFFKQAKKHVQPHFIIFYKKNDQNLPRLGLVIGKKHLKKAVQRNTAKRVIRESFRYHQHLLNNTDVVIVGRHNLHELSKQVLRQQLDNQWRHLAS